MTAGTLRHFGALLLASLLGGAAATVVAGQTGSPASQVLRARRIEIVDGNGAVRAHLETDPTTGIVNLSLFDANRRPRVWLGASDIPALILWDAAGTPRTTLGLNRDGAAVLEMRDASNLESQRPAARRVVIGSGQRSLPNGVVETFQPSSLLLFDRDEKLVFKAP